MEPQFRCLIMDHDDTVVNSTASIHYPAHLEMMRFLRPDTPPLSLEDWFRWNFHPGVMAYFTGELGMSEDEIAEELRIWRTYTSTRIPRFYPGMAGLLRDFTDAGGIVTVVSHSEAQFILRDYKADGIAPLPKAIYGWDMDEKKRKPGTWPVEQILSRFGFEPDEVLLVDDLKPGIDMAGNCGIPSAAAGWGHDIDEIRVVLTEAAEYYLPSIQDLRELVFNRFPTGR